MTSLSARLGGSATLTPRPGGGSPDPSDDDFDWDSVVPRRCHCGYVNTEPGRCPACGAKDPDAPRGATRRRAPEPTSWSPDPGFAPATVATGPDPDRRTGSNPPRRGPLGRLAIRTVAGIIVLNVVQQVVVVAIIFGNHLEAGPAIRLSLLSGLVFYSIVALWVLGRSAYLGVRPVLTSGNPWTGAAMGAVVGGGLAIFFVAGTFLLTGRPLLDPMAAALSDQTMAAFVIGAILIAVVAPIVEELVFRGFLAEALRPRGRGAALVLSAAAFSISHLRFAQFRYYVAMGLVLGGLYWQRGLVASVSAHACFNGMLIVAALAASHGPPVTLAGGGASITVPPAWHTVSSHGRDLIAASGPSGALIEVVRVDLFRTVTAQQMASNLAEGRGGSIPGVRIDPSSVVMVDLAAGPAVSMSVTVGRHDGRAVMLVRDMSLWVVTVETAGSSRADTDFRMALDTLQLP